MAKLEASIQRMKQYLEGRPASSSAKPQFPKATGAPREPALIPKAAVAKHVPEMQFTAKAVQRVAAKSKGNQLKGQQRHHRHLRPRAR
eukprot:2563359-Karenia_brevis.AAC.1